MFVTDFEYADKRLSDFGYIVCHVNTESGLRDVDIGCDITFNTVKNNHSFVTKKFNSCTFCAFRNIFQRIKPQYHHTPLLYFYA